MSSTIASRCELMMIAAPSDARAEIESVATHFTNVDNNVGTVGEALLRGWGLYGRNT